MMLVDNKFDKRITGTVIQISRKGEIFVDFKYKADGIIPRKEYSDDETKNPKDRICIPVFWIFPFSYFTLTFHV